jgi:hypothetical protein
MDGQLAHIPFTHRRIILGHGEDVLLGVVQLRKFDAIVVAGRSGFHAEQGVSGHGLSGPDPVIQLPGSLELVEVLGAIRSRSSFSIAMNRPGFCGGSNS